MSQKSSLFSKLTKLFRSGPVIKRNVRKLNVPNNAVSSTAVDVFRKAHSDVYNATVSAYGSFDRMSRYSDFAEMEATPEICSALDIYAEETVSPDEKGNVLHIYSDNRKIQDLLHNLFYDVLNVEFNLVMWARNLCKYGDFFLFNDIHPEYGVINAYPIAISEIEREESFDPNDPAAVRFRWIAQGNQILENWQISHFRLLGNDAFLPYGSSVLEGARRIWRQLILIEDAMLVYRVIRAPERRVFYIDVGNVPPEEVANYLEQVQTSLKRNQIIDRQTGKVDLRYNPLSVEEDFFLPVRGGESGTKIDTLAGGQNASAIEDVQYIQNKLFSALKIPKAYLGYDAEIGSKATLSQEDIRFSRTIQRIQKTVVSELNKLAQIHLYCHGYEGNDLADFELYLSNPSTVAQMQKLELIRTRFEIAGQAPEGSVNRKWIQKNVLGLNDYEIEEIKKGRIQDKKLDLELEAVTAEPAAGDAGGGDLGGGDLGGGDDSAGATDTTAGGDEGGGDLDSLFNSTQKDKRLKKINSGYESDDNVLDSLPLKPHSNDSKDELEENDDYLEEIDISKLSILDANAPLRADAAIRRATKLQPVFESDNVFGEKMTVRSKNKPRRRRSLQDRALHDVDRIINNKDSRDTVFNDPYGLKTEDDEQMHESSNFTPPRLSFDLIKTLSKMNNYLGRSKVNNKLLTESEGGEPDGKA